MHVSWGFLAPEADTASLPLGLTSAGGKPFLREVDALSQRAAGPPPSPCLCLTQADAHLPKALACAVHDLYLALMADQPFKTRIAAAYVQALPKVTANYASGIGAAEYA